MPAHRAPRHLREERGFTLIEVLVATLLLCIGLVGMFSMLDFAAKSTNVDRLRQAELNVARQALESARNLSYNSLTGGSAIASALASSLGGTASGSTLSVNRTAYTSGTSSATANADNYALTLTFSACSLDDPSDGYGDHSSAPASGGSWCPDVASSGTSDSTPDDMKRVSVTVSDPSVRNDPGVEQATLIYNSTTSNPPAVTCLTATSGSCPGAAISGAAEGSTLTFYVTTTSTPSQIEWFVKGSVPTGYTDPYGVSSTTSSFTWTTPSGSYASGIYTITAEALDSSGNAGTPMSIVVQVN
jgi:prepilin-type N-terminal cleavage/methylation domain-containing protein